MKKKFAVVGASALAGVLAVTAAGCASTPKSLASLSSNWYYDTEFKRIQPTFTEDNAEILEYTVFQAEKTENRYYSVEYCGEEWTDRNGNGVFDNGDEFTDINGNGKFDVNGKYTTTFYAEKVTAELLAAITLDQEEATWRTEYEAAFKKGGYLYCYKTELFIPRIIFTSTDNTVEPKTFENNSIVTVSYFLSVEDYLRPIYSKRTVDMVIPMEPRGNSMETYYYEEDMEYESFYNLSGSSVKTFITDNNADGKKTVFSPNNLSKNSNTVFDAAYLDIVARAMKNIGSTFSQTVGIYTPGLNVNGYTVASVNKPLSSDELIIMEELLEKNGLFTPKPLTEENLENSASSLKTAAVGVAYSGGNFSGVSQTYWFAIGDGNNETRTVMIKYSEPLSFSLGRIDYVLTDIKNIYI